MYFMMSTKKDHDSAVRAGLMGSEGLYDFFMDMYKLNPFDVAKDLQVYALQKKNGTHTSPKHKYALLTISPKITSQVNPLTAFESC